MAKTVEEVLRVRRFMEAFLEDTFVYLTPDESLEALEGKDLCAIVRPHLIEREWARPFVPLFTLDELSERTEGFITHLESNRAHLLATGFSETGFAQCEWLQVRLGNLYYTREPLRRRGRQGQPGEWIYDFVWVAGHDKSTGNVTPTSSVYEAATLLRLDPKPWPADDSPNQEQEFEMISVGDERQVLSLRATVFDLRIAVLRRLLKAVREHDASELRTDCLTLFVRFLTREQKEFLLRADTWYLPPQHREFAALYAISTRAGGLSDLLDVIGHFEREINLGRLAITRRHLFGLMSIDDNGRPSVVKDLYWTTSHREPFYATVTAYTSRTFAHAGHVTDYLFWRDHILASGWEPATTSVTGSPVSDGNLFYRDKNRWVIAYQGVQIHVDDVPQRSGLKELKGLRCIAHLLSRPLVEVHVRDLVRLIDGAQSISEDFQRLGKERAHADEGLRDADDGADPGTKPDQDAREAYLEAIRELTKDLTKAKETGNEAAIEQIQIQLTWYRNELGTGTVRRGESPMNRAMRTRIQKAIRTARIRIQNTHPELGMHLLKSIETGTQCRYMPQEPTQWDTRSR